MPKKLAGKVAVVTGASKGIGAEIARQLADEGASVVVNYASSKEGAERVVADIAKKGGKAVAVQANVAKPADIRRLFDEAKKAFGRLDVLVNNAGIYEFAPLESITAEHFHKLFDLNVLGLLLTTQEAARHFGPEGGSVVNISSVASTLAPPTTSVYSATKAAVDAVTRSLSKELAPRKIRVNSINPGINIGQIEGVYRASRRRTGVDRVLNFGRCIQTRKLAGVENLSQPRRGPSPSHRRGRIPEDRHLHQPVADGGRGTGQGRKARRRALESVVASYGAGVLFGDRASAAGEAVRLNAGETCARSRRPAVADAARENQQVGVRRGHRAAVQQAGRVEATAVAGGDAVQRVVLVRAAVFDRHTTRGRRHAAECDFHRVSADGTVNVILIKNLGSGSVGRRLYRRADGAWKRSGVVRVNDL